jgi:hypothetical protein
MKKLARLQQQKDTRKEWREKEKEKKKAKKRALKGISLNPPSLQLTL